jgi:hypothetical protein
MNIFVTDEDPYIAARNLCDKHVRSKMIIESAIMLQKCFTQEQLAHPDCPRTKTGKIRKASGGYSNHQCTKWVKASYENFIWLLSHTCEMLKERQLRWPHAAKHFTQDFIEWCVANKDKTTHSNISLTPFTVAINKNSKCRLLRDFDELPVTRQYQAYIKHDKPFAIWTNRRIPDWVNK